MNPGDIFGFLQNLRNNPLGLLAQRGYNIPQNISNDPNKILQHLLTTGQITQEQYNNAYNQAMMFRKR